MSRGRVLICSCDADDIKDVNASGKTVLCFDPYSLAAFELIIDSAIENVKEGGGKGIILGTSTTNIDHLFTQGFPGAFVDYEMAFRMIDYVRCVFPLSRLSLEIIGASKYIGN